MNAECEKLVLFSEGQLSPQPHTDNAANVRCGGVGGWGGKSVPLLDAFLATEKTH